MGEGRILKAAEAKLHEYFIYEGFKSEEQKTCILELMSGRDVLALLPTSAGKSLCYQIPALYFPGLTIVVTPLQALMHDQVDRLGPTDRGLKKPVSAEYIDSTRADQTQILRSVSEGKYQLLYVAPERLMHPAFLQAVKKRSVDFIAVDEAHCLSMWGYDFRPAYLDLLRFIRRLPKRPVIGAFTATATQAVKADIIRLLQMDLGGKEPCRGLVEGSFERDNLIFSIREFRRRENKKAALLKYVAAHEKDAGIVYCTTVHEAAELYRDLEAYHPVWYHGKLEDRERRENSRKFMAGESRLMVATSAFGMGIDKQDIRFVVHYNMPRDLESYYQEAGRAGRDQAPAECLLLCHRSERTWDDNSICRQFLKVSEENTSLPGEIIKYRERLGSYRLEQMNRYCDQKKCSSKALQDFITQYFKNELPESLLDPEYRKQEAEYLRQRAKTLDLRAEKVSALCYNNTKIANEIRKGAYELGEEKLIDCGRKQAKGGRTKEGLLISYRIESEAGEKLTYFDMMVADAVYTLEQYLVPVLYPKTIYEVLSGDPSVTLKPDKKDMIERRLEKMRRTWITVDCTQAAEAQRSMGEGHTPPLVYSGRFLPLEKRGEKGYTYTEIPPLYQFASVFLNGQFYRFPMSRLRIVDAKGSKMASSEENLRLVYYLLYRLMSMTGNKKSRETGKSALSRVILYDTLFQVTGLEEELPKEKVSRERKRKTLLKKVDAICDYYRRAGQIEGWFPCLDTEYSTSKKAVYKGIQICFLQNQ